MPFPTPGPDSALELPGDLSIDENYVVTWTPSESNKSYPGMYLVNLLEQRTPGAEWTMFRGNGFRFSSDEGLVDFSSVLREKGPGTYGVLIGAFSANIQEIAHSGYSEMLTFTYQTEPEEVTVALNKTSLTVEKGKTATLTAAVQPESAQVTWSNSNPGVAAVDQNGTVTAVGFGTAKITATAAQGGNKASASCDVTVPGVVFEQEEVYLQHAQVSYTLKHTVYPAGAQVVWSSNAPHIANVDPQTGLVTTVSPGSTVIGAAVTVPGEDGRTITALSACQVTVFNCYLEEPALTIEKGDSKSMLLCTDYMPQGHELVTKSSDPKVAAVDGMSIRAVGMGNATVTVTVRHNGKDLMSLDCAVTVPGISLDSSLTVYQGKTAKLTATTVPEGSTVTWHSANPGVATVDQNGLVTAVSVGTAEVTASITYNEISVTEKCSVQVSRLNFSSYFKGNRDFKLGVSTLNRKIPDNLRDEFLDWLLAQESVDADVREGLKNILVFKK